MNSSKNLIQIKDTVRPVGIDLFAGAGGLSLGFEQAGFDIAAAVELDPIHCATHEFNFPRCATICASVSDLSGKEIRKRSNLGNQQVDVVFGGAPCQGFSMIGKRMLDDPRNRLVFHFVRIAKELKANYFVFENVRGLTVGKHRQLLDEVVAELESSGYDVRLPYRVLNAAEYGVPQDRQRLFLLASRRGHSLPSYPRASLVSPTVWDAIGDLPEPTELAQLVDSDTALRARYKKPSRYAAILRGLVDDDSDYSYQRVWDRRSMTSSMRTVHTALSQRRFLRTKNGKVEPVSRFLKLDPLGIANTLRAGTASDRGAFTSPRPVHPYAPRCITVREAARLHSYPDWFRFHVTKWHGFRQVGNSVPPLLARAVASEIMVALNGAPSKLSDLFPLGDERLLRLTMKEAAERYGVPSNVIAGRLRRVPGDHATAVL